jgi:DNA-binding NtrC family response regulator
MLKGRALIVDDDYLGCRSLARLLTRMGFDVREAGSAREAMDALRFEPADVVVSDYSMPVEDGVTFLHEVARDFPESVRVFYSGTVPNPRIKDALARGVALRHFTKGDDLQALLNFLRELAPPAP